MVVCLRRSSRRTMLLPLLMAVATLICLVAVPTRADGTWYASPTALDLPVRNGDILGLDEEPATWGTGGWPSGDPGPMTVTIVDSTPCAGDGYCVCKVLAPSACAADYEYRALDKLRERLDEADKIAGGASARQLADSQTELLRKLASLQERLSQQPPSASQAELNRQRQDLERLMSQLAQLEHNLASSNAAAAIQKELQDIANALAAVESRNPEAVQVRMKDEIDALRDRLARCNSAGGGGDGEASSAAGGGGRLAGRSTPFPGDYLPYNETYGKCSSSRNITVGSEVTHRHRNSASWWGKDARPRDDAARSAIYEIRETESSSSTIFSWTSYADFSSTEAERLARRSGCAFPIHGRKNVIVGGYLFYAEAWRQRAVWRLDLSTCSTDRLPLNLDTAEFNLYAHKESTFVDLNYDETGLYAVYADAAQHGRLVIAKIDPDDLTLLAAWTTGRVKSSVANVFFVCGRMYTTDAPAAAHLSGRQYGYDTATSEEFYVDGLDVESRFGGVRQLSYNPRERLIFGFDNQHLVTYRMSLG